MPLLTAVRLGLQGPQPTGGEERGPVSALLSFAKPSSQGKSEANHSHQNLENQLVHVPSGTEGKIPGSELGFGHSRALAGI